MEDSTEYQLGKLDGRMSGVEAWLKAIDVKLNGLYVLLITGGGVGLWFIITHPIVIK